MHTLHVSLVSVQQPTSDGHAATILIEQKSGGVVAAVAAIALAAVAAVVVAWLHSTA